jgi:hypothetical protein
LTWIALLGARAETSPMVAHTRYAKNPDGGYIAYKVLGEGPPDIAVVGSIATNIEVFFEHEPAARFWLELATFSRLILHDRRGTGLSDDMGGWPNLETRAADLLAVLDAVGSRRPTIACRIDSRCRRACPPSGCKVLVASLTHGRDPKFPRRRTASPASRPHPLYGTLHRHCRIAPVAVRSTRGSGLCHLFRAPGRRVASPSIVALRIRVRSERR